MIKILKFEATWCGNCKQMEPAIQEVVEKTGATLEKIDVEKRPDLAAQYFVMGIPRTIVLKDDEVVADVAGVKPAGYFLDLLS